jgi:RNA polymerase sigma-70 factor (ECF subfamily)
MRRSTGGAAYEEKGPVKSRGSHAKRPAEDTIDIAALLEGDSAAFEALLDAYGPRVIGACRNILEKGTEAVGAVDPDDCLQHAALRLIERLDSVRFQHHLQAGRWLTTTAKHYCIDQMRKHCRESSIERLRKIEDEMTGAAIRSAIEARDDLRRLLEGVPERDRKILYFRHYLGMTSSEIAAHMEDGSTDASIRQQLSRLRRRLQEKSRAFTSMQTKQGVREG